MCGITGITDFNGISPNEYPILDKMTDSLSHRGPDARGIYTSPFTVLGHRRLAVIDIQGGAQPMKHRVNDAEYTIVYNGELYNTDELKKSLIECGHSFISHSDTEVLLHAYIQWGTGCLERLNGIFAFAVWDEQAQTLFLARDRVGVKPLFYHVDGQRLTFASEIKALLAHERIQPVVDRDGLCELFGLGPCRTPGCGVFKDIQEVLPAHYLVFNRDGVHSQAYWALSYEPHYESLYVTVNDLKDLVIDSIQRQLVSDVPLGTFLSGGLDSSIITAVAAKQYKEEGRILDTFSVDYDENDKYFKSSAFQPNPDAPWVERMSQYLGTRHHNIVLGYDELAEALHESTLMRDLPGMADIDSSLLLFCRKIKETVTVSVSGECADEILGGYPWFRKPQLLADGLFPWSADIGYRQAFLSSELKELLPLEEYVRFRYSESVAAAPPYGGYDENERQMRVLFHLNIQWFMANLLERKDRMSMASGLEVRVPYCDHRLMDYIWNIPWAQKNAAEREKGVLRLAMEGILPADVLWRKKSPYPKTFHPAYTSAVRLLLQDEISGNSPLLELVDKDALTALMNEENPIGKPWFGQLMSGPQLMAYMVQIGQWLRQYKVIIKAD